MKKIIHPKQIKVKVILNNGSIVLQSFTSILHESKTTLSLLDTTVHFFWNKTVLNNSSFGDISRKKQSFFRESDFR